MTPLVRIPDPPFYAEKYSAVFLIPDLCSKPIFLTPKPCFQNLYPECNYSVSAGGQNIISLTFKRLEDPVL